MLITSSWKLDLLLFSLGVIFLFYKYFTRKFNYWKDRSVNYVQPTVFFGNTKDLFFFKKPIGDWMKDIYDSTQGRFVGIFIVDEPALILKCPELIKRIAVKDFNYFMDRTAANPEHNALISNMMFFQKGSEWRTVRTKMTPIYTSGKLKGMYPLIQTVGVELVRYLENHLGEQEAKEICSKFAIDVISKCAFGINAHCLDDENASFRKIGKAMFDFNIRNAVTQTSYFFRQSWVHMFKLDFFEKSIQKYFAEAFWSTMKQREITKIKSNDLLDHLRDMMNNKDLPFFVGDKVAAQATQFFAAGFETTASTIAHTLYEFAINKDVQDKARSDILKCIKDHGLTYEGISEMKYLDLCVQETLRKYPVLPFLDRKCVDDYHVPDSDLVIEKGTCVYIPLYGLHLDAKYFENPEKYVPERFLENVNSKANGLVYMPFGEGPRSCIGERFGTMSTKTALVYILKNFEVERCSKTPVPIEFEPKTFTMQSKVGLPMIFKRYTSST